MGHQISIRSVKSVSGIARHKGLGKRVELSRHGGAGATDVSRERESQRMAMWIVMNRTVNSAAADDDGPIGTEPSPMYLVGTRTSRDALEACPEPDGCADSRSADRRF